MHCVYTYFLAPFQVSVLFHQLHLMNILWEGDYEIYTYSLPQCSQSVWPHVPSLYDLLCSPLYLYRCLCVHMNIHQQGFIQRGGQVLEQECAEKLKVGNWLVQSTSDE